ncbi:hypothetical protein DFH27DRAFT_645376 [Peziza echinospora]|nr:hypothetical protein DFH27DRAFT_645376 [Peziza echinospora]
MYISGIISTLLGITALVSAGVIIVPPSSNSPPDSKALPEDVRKFGDVTCSRSTKAFKGAIQQKHAYALIQQLSDTIATAGGESICTSRLQPGEKELIRPAPGEGDHRRVQCIRREYVDGVESGLGFWGTASDNWQVEYSKLYDAAKKMRDCLSLDPAKLENWVSAEVWAQIEGRPGLSRTFWMGRSIFES